MAATKTQTPEMVEAEKVLRAKYPHVVKGTLAESGAFKDFGHKRTVLIKCVDCRETRRIATSDCFQAKRCIDCAKEAKNAARREFLAARESRANGKSKKSVKAKVKVAKAS